MATIFYAAIPNFFSIFADQNSHIIWLTPPSDRSMDCIQYTEDYGY